MKSGNYKDYHWVEWERATIPELLVSVPDIVAGRYLVNTSFDSGKLFLSDEEKLQGWRSVGDLTYSPQIKDANSIPHDQFDEWLIFLQPTEIPSWEAVINYGGLSLGDQTFDWIHQKLWPQIETVRPESYLAEGDRLIFITRNMQMHKLALAQKDLDTAAV